MADSIIDSLKQILQKSPDVVGRMTWDAWASETSTRAATVKLMREYAEGEHRAKLTDDMIALLRLQDAGLSEGQSPFNLNHMDNIIQTLVDRLEITGMETDIDAGTAWVKALQEANDFDGLQVDVAEGAVGDGDAFVMVAYDNETKKAIFTHEYAYDGIEGIIPIYTGGTRALSVAIKIWRENVRVDNKLTEQVRVNVYFDNRIEKYITSGSGGKLEEFKDDPADKWPYAWVDRAGKPLGVPIIHFPNRSKKYDHFGKSEISDVISTQDALNRVLVSMVMATELTGFQIRTAVGARPPAALSPGMWISVVPRDPNGKDITNMPSKETVDWLNSIKFGTLDVGPLAPFLEESMFLIEQMYEITRTPRAASAGASSSGEALKQREIGLIGKARRCQISFGNAWEKVFRMARRVEETFSAKPPPVIERITAKWRSPQIRDSTQVVDNTMKLKDVIDRETLLQAVAGEFGWDTAQIKAIIKAKEKETSDRFGALRDSFPTFTDGGNAGNAALQPATPQGVTPVADAQPIPAGADG